MVYFPHFSSFSYQKHPKNAIFTPKSALLHPFCIEKRPKSANFTHKTAKKDQFYLKMTKFTPKIVKFTLKRVYFAQIKAVSYQISTFLYQILPQNPEKTHRLTANSTDCWLCVAITISLLLILHKTVSRHQL
jgi:hypothetical protein